MAHHIMRTVSRLGLIATTLVMSACSVTPPVATGFRTQQAAPAPAQPMRVLMVLGNRDFYYREYAEPRAELERYGLAVEVAAATRTPCRPHVASGQGADGGIVQPDLTVQQADSQRYAAVVFVGGWGASHYQPAFPGRYQDGTYNGSDATRQSVNRLVESFTRQGKYVTAICHGVSVLAWSRIDGRSPLAGRRVAAHNGPAPAASLPSGRYLATTRWHVESNGATMVPSRSIGDPRTSADDVVVDGRLITAEDYDSARQFGCALVRALLRR